jgi:phosphomannomutase
MMELLKELGCEVVGINLEQTGRFAHPPEPIPEHLARPTLIPPRRLLQSLFCATG